MIKHRERISTVSIGLNNRQIEFFEVWPQFDKSKFIRKCIDGQIRLIDGEYLEEK